MENVTLTDIQTTVVVLLAVLAALSVVDKGVSAFTNIFCKGGAGMKKRIESIEEKQGRDFVRLNSMTRQLNRVNDDMGHVLNAMNAILMHEITGNGVDKLKETKMDLDDYMAMRGTNAYQLRDDGT